MHHRTTKVALAAVLVIAFVLGLSGTALAQWPDLTLSILGDYGITEAEVAAISDGFTDGTWKPYAKVTRQQFTKMAVDAYQIPLVNPATPTYSDVPPTSDFYMYIEAATAAGLTNGVGGGLFNPTGLITREQAAAIIARWVADKNGYDLETMYTQAEIDAVLGAYPDGAQVSPSLQAEMAFAVDFAIVWGDASGNLAPKSDMTRIQGAAMLIRSWSIIPDVTPPVPADITLVSDDESENLIGLTHQYTYKVTDAAGAPIEGVLVDFDTLFDQLYVGNIQPEAALTDENGEATVNLISTEVGIQRVSAAAPGLLAIWSTKYWVALDEVYILDATRSSQNNAGSEHEWQGRVAVFGPGPLSTSARDWYNAYNPAGDPASPDEMDGVDWPYGYVEDVLNDFYQNQLPVGFGNWDDFDEMVAWVEAFLIAHSDMPDNIENIIQTLLSVDRWTYQSEQVMGAHGFLPRSLEGIPVTWAIVDQADNPYTEDVDESFESVGEITAVEFDGSIESTTVAKAFTDADGLTTVTITSDKTGQTLVELTADYAGNPYEGQLFSHWAEFFGGHAGDWDDQPMPQAMAIKTWIPHVIGGDDEGPIDPDYTEANLGEQFTLTITLVDVFGNPIEGRQVEWFMQGVGWFETDDENTVKNQDDPAGNRDMDVTDAAGSARVFVKSYDPGEQIVHAKVRDKGTGGNEGQFITYDAEVQWFDVDVATFDDITTDGEAEDCISCHNENTEDLAHNDSGGWIAPENEAWSSNTVGTDHTYTLHVYGLKLELDPSVDDPKQQTPFIDTDYPGAAYDGIFDWRDAAYFGEGAVLLINPHEAMIRNGDPIEDQGALDIAQSELLPLASNGQDSGWPHDVDDDGVIDDNMFERGTAVVDAQGREIVVSGVGGHTRFDWDMDGYKETFHGQTGIYLPLAGKDVTFENVDNLIGTYFDENGIVESVGGLTPEEAVTDENGEADVTVSSDDKGPQTVQATVDWEHNPHNGPELVQAYAKKIWVADEAITIVVEVDSEEVAMWEDGEDSELSTPINPVWVEPGDFTPAEAIETNVDDPNVGQALNMFHVEVHVYDQFGNDLPDYEVVYTLEELGTWLNGKQDASDTYLPLAYLFDADTANEIDGDEYDMNGTEPDHDEPTPESDPYAIIVGDGGTHGFYFNQWLGAGLGSNSDKNVYEGVGFYTYSHAGTDYTVPGYVQLPPKVAGQTAFGYYTNAFGVGLITDGAKAWTLDGYFQPEWGEGDVFPNLYTGSHIDVQLLEDPFETPAGHAKTIVGIKVYEPADGIVTDTQPLWQYQIHKVWETPVVTEIILEPADAVNADDQSHTLTATVLDQFGNPMPNVPVTFWGIASEGGSPYDATTPGAYNDVELEWPGGPVTTDADGKAVVTDAAVAWSAWEIWAEADGVESNTATKYWALASDFEAYEMTLILPAGLGADYDGLTVEVHKFAASQPVVATGVYSNAAGVTLSSSSTFAPGDRVFVEFLDDALDNDLPNWIWNTATTTP